MRLNRNDGFTRLELLFVVVAIAAIGLLSIIWFKRHERHSTINCVANLKLVGLGFRAFAIDNEGLYPMQIATNGGGTLEVRAEASVFRHFQALSNYAPDSRIVTCPQDKRKPSRSWAIVSDANLSYFIGPDASETNAFSFLSGDRNIGPTLNGRVILNLSGVTWQTEVGLHGSLGNILFGDGHVGSLDQDGLKQAVKESPKPGTSVLLIP